ncbi:MAG TPA: amidohydrolase family protein, partial [Candidatus Acidoferrum sp.]|nr:amidohydrolase family protein [Candidatus Acidoferrum sp.]
MRVLVPIFGFVLSLFVSSCQAQTQAPALLLHEVTVIDATGAPPRRGVDVLIRGERIEKIGPHIQPPPSAQLIQARGQFLIPGLWDMHLHIWDAELAFPLLIANGVTGVRNTGGRPDDLRRWREELREGKRHGPRLVACGPVVDGPPPIHPDHSVVVENATQGTLAVDNLKSQGWDFIKVYDNVPRDAYFAVAAEAKKDGVPFVGHVPLSVTAIEASDAGQNGIEHLDGLDYVISPAGGQFRRDRLERIGKPPQPGEMMKLPLRIANEINQLADTYDEKRAGDVFARLKRNGTWQVPTLSVARVYASIGSAALYQDERLKYVKVQERDAWEHNPIVHRDIPEYVAARNRAFQQAMRLTTAAHRAGVSFMAGTDSGGVPYLYYGFSLHDELALLVEAGFTPMQALQAATRDPARFLGLADELGT